MKKRLLALFCAVTLVFTGLSTTGLTSLIASAATATPGLIAAYYQPKGHVSDGGRFNDIIRSAVPGDNQENHGNTGATEDISEDNRLFDESLPAIYDATELIAENVTITGLDQLANEGVFGIGGDGFMTVMTGDMTVKEKGNYTFSAKIDNSLVIELIDKESGDPIRVFEFWGRGSWADAGDGVAYYPNHNNDTIALEAKTYTVKAYFAEYWGGNLCQVSVRKDGGNLVSYTDYFTLANATASAYGFYGFTGDYDKIAAKIPTEGGGGQNVTADASKRQYDATIADIKDVVSYVGTAVDSNGIYGNFLDLASQLGCNGDNAILVEYTGYMTPHKAGAYTFGLAAVDNAVMMEISLDGGNTYQRVLEYWTKGAWYDAHNQGIYYDNNTYAAVTLEAGKAYPVRAAFLELDGGQALEIIANSANGEQNLTDAFALTTNDAEIETDYASPLSLNVLAVNAYGGSTAVGSKLTVQYTDATLGGNDGTTATAEVKLHAAVINKANGTRVECAETHPLNYTTINDQSNDQAADNSTSRIVASAKMGALAFTMPDVGTTDVNNLAVEVWSENGQDKSVVTTRSINAAFDPSTTAWNNVSGSDWMAYIDGSQPISQITIPGTHDTAALDFETIADSNAICQTVYIPDQLNYGVRYLDIRVHSDAGSEEDLAASRQYLSNGTKDLPLVHGSYNAFWTDGSNYMLSQAIEACYNFLEAHPTEFIFFNVQADGGADYRDDGRFQDILHQIIAKHPDRWYTKAAIPTLDEVRGKIMYTRRFEAGGRSDAGAGARFFMKEQTDTGSTSTYVSGSAITCNETVRNQPREFVYHIQDYYKASSNSNKQTLFKNNLNSMMSKPAGEIVLNALNRNSGVTNKPLNNASTNNAAVITTTVLAPSSGNHYGIIQIDGVTAAYAKTIFQTNIKSTNPATTDSSHDELVLHYDFKDENVSEDNVVKDVSGNGRDGKIVNSTASATVADGAVTLNNMGKLGTNAAAVNLPSYAFRGTNDTATISFWINPTSLPRGQAALLCAGNKDGSDGQYGTEYNWGTIIAQSYLDGGNGLRLVNNTKDIYPESGHLIASTKSLYTNKWQLFSYVIDGGNLYVYLNNELIIEDTSGTWSSFDDLGNKLPISLGRTTRWNDGGYVGKIGDFKIYNYARTPAQIAEEYNALVAETADTTYNDKLVLHYDFDSANGTTIADKSGSGFNGTIINPALTSVENGAITLNNDGKTTDNGAAGVSLPGTMFNNVGNAYTFSYWIRPDRVARDTLFSLGQSEDTGWGVMMTNWDNGPRVAMRANNIVGGEKYGNSNGNLAPNKWQLVTMVMDRNTAKYYVNGVEVLNQMDQWTGFNEMGENLKIELGRPTIWTGDNAYVGSIGDFKIYNYARSAEQIMNDYHELNATNGYRFSATKNDANGYPCATEPADMIATPYQSATTGTTTFAKEATTLAYRALTAADSATYKIPLDSATGEAYLNLAVGGNYQIQVSANGTTWTAPTVMEPFSAATNANGANIDKVVVDATSYLSNGVVYVKVASTGEGRFYRCEVCYDKETYLGTASEYGFRVNSTDEVPYMAANDASVADDVNVGGSRRFADGGQTVTWNLPLNLNASKQLVAAFVGGEGLKMEVGYNGNFVEADVTENLGDQWQLIDVTEQLKAAQADANAVQGKAYVQLRLADLTTDGGNGGVIREIKVKSYYGMDSEVTGNGSITFSAPDFDDDRTANEQNKENRNFWSFSNNAKDLTVSEPVIAGYTPATDGSEIYISDYATVKVAIKAADGNSIIPGTVMGYQNGEATYIPTRDGWRTSDLQSVNHTIVLDESTVGMTLKMTAKADGDLTAEDSIGLIGHSINPDKNGLRSVYRLRGVKTDADGKYWITIGGETKEIKSFGVLLGAKSVVDATGEPFDMTNSSNKIKYYDFADKFESSRYDVADQHLDICLTVTGLTGANADAKLMMRGYVELADGTFAYTEPSEKAYSDYTE